MRKLILAFAAILTTSAPAAFAAGGPLPAPQPEPDAPAPPPGTEIEPLSDRQERQVAATVRHERTVERARERRAAERRASAPVAVPAHLQAIAQCESGGDPAAVGGGGQFRGKYQFTYATWAAVGGKGDPATAPEAEQDRRAITLYAQAGPGQWPVCSQ